MNGPSNDEIDSELSLAIMCYDPKDKYPEWSNSAMREAYRAGWEDGQDGASKPIRDLHRPVSISAFSTARMSGSKAECSACNRGWPCATARLVYSAEELS